MVHRSVATSTRAACCLTQLPSRQPVKNSRIQRTISVSICVSRHQKSTRMTLRIDFLLKCARQQGREPFCRKCGCMCANCVHSCALPTNPPTCTASWRLSANGYLQFDFLPGVFFLRGCILLHQGLGGNGRESVSLTVVQGACLSTFLIAAPLPRHGS